MKKLLIMTTSAFCLNIGTVQAEEKYNHFPALDAPTTSAALCNLAAYNERLKAIVNKKSLTPEDMVKVHELTYTLENAVIKLQNELETIAVDLEKVHKASEHLDSKTIETSGQKYLTATQLILATNSCK